RHRAYLARIAAPLRRHRRQLFRPFHHIPRRRAGRSMTCEIIHRTLYAYSEAVTVSQHAARVEPRSLPGQTLEEFSLRIDPPPALRKGKVDYFGNRVCFFSIQEVHSRLEIIARSRVTVAASTPPALSL